MELKDRTPEVMRCVIVGCPAIYEVVDRTPESYDCLVGPCPGIYEARREGKRDDCIAGVGCPDIQPRGNVYLIIGKQVDPKDAGLEKKVGAGEVLIEVPRRLIDEMERGVKGV
jgi:hypothetical protein